MLRRLLEKAIDVCAIACFTGVLLCVLGQVVFRYVLGNPLVWSEELARYLFVWCALLGWIIASRRQTHLAMTFVADKLPARGRAVLDIAIALVAVGFGALLVRWGSTIVAANSDVETVTLPFTVGAVYAIVPVAGLAIAAYALVAIAASWRVIAGAAGGNAATGQGARR